MSEYLPIAGSRGAVPGLAIVQVDGVTIVGDGTAEEPLRAAPGALVSTFLGQDDAEGELLVGSPVRAKAGALDPDAPGIALLDDALDDLPVVGVVIAVELVAGVRVCTVRTYGLVTLTVDEWDAVTGQSGGLIRGAPYYIGPASGGLMTTVVPTGPNFINRVGVALSPLVLLLTIPVLPLEAP
jgi:hypothetical protein